MKDREPEAFQESCMQSDIHVWIKTFFKPWSEFRWLALIGNAIDKKFLSTINKVLIDKFSIRSFCY